MSNPDKFKQTRAWCGHRKPKNSKKLLRMKKRDLAKIGQTITNFSNFNSHTAKKDKNISPLCRLCGLKPETGWHLAFECSKTAHLKIRSQIFDPTMEALQEMVNDELVENLLLNRKASHPT